jgi:hypothetical protein
MAVAGFREMLERDRMANGFTVGQVAWRLGMSPAQYREHVEGERWPDFRTLDRMCRLFGWPQTFARSRTPDHVIPPALQEEMYERAGAHITRVKTGHLSLITRPGAVLRVILSAVKTTT